jgi:hypothetical protein
LDNIQAHVYGQAVEQIAAVLGAAERCEDAWKMEEEQRKVPCVAAEFSLTLPSSLFVSLNISLQN